MSGKETSALNEQCDSTHSAISSALPGRNPAFSIIHSLMAVSISE